MSGREARLADAAGSLRRAFDRSFTEALRTEIASFENALAIRVGGDSYVLRLGEIAGLFADKKITQVPSRAPGLLGIAGFRGAIVSVYDLGALLGHPASSAPRWIALSEADSTVGVAFEELDGYLRLPLTDITPHQTGGAVSPHVRELAKTRDGARPLIDLRSVLEALKTRAVHDS